MLRFIITKDYREMSKQAAKAIAEDMRWKTRYVLGTATGGTPLGTYKELVRLYEQGQIDFSNVISFGLDEYIGLPSNHVQCYTRYMWENFFSHINILKTNTNMPPGIFDDAEIEINNYEKRIENAGGIDLQILGVGRNGHIGFNEPGEVLHARTHLATLTKQTIEDNARYFSSIDEVPKQALAMGVGSIFKARKIVFIASGEEKAEAVRKTFNGYVDTYCPSTLLQMHPNLIVILDEEAASKLDLSSIHTNIEII